ncbi:hypothetical protein M513_11454 [Trichuris suis]|uniref:Uncharacterized protein n=1 Tax=Trichuris suis TaxID=68888 RepID=A0A085LRR7_9BILA|nr:hypothetical protein M513_11454 [Trichuris suis]
MQQLLGSSARSVDDVLFRELFLQRLQSSVRMILASPRETVNVQTLAEITDKILEATTSPWRDLNSRPLDPWTSALTIELQRLAKEAVISNMI